MKSMLNRQMPTRIKCVPNSVSAEVVFIPDYTAACDAKRASLAKARLERSFAMARASA